MSEFSDILDRYMQACMAITISEAFRQPITKELAEELSCAKLHLNMFIEDIDDKADHALHVAGYNPTKS